LLKIVIKTILFYKLCEAQFTFMFMTFRNHVHLTPVSKLRLASTLPQSPGPRINFFEYFQTTHPKINQINQNFDAVYEQPQNQHVSGKRRSEN